MFPFISQGWCLYRAGPRQVCPANRSLFYGRYADLHLQLLPLVLDRGVDVRIYSQDMAVYCLPRTVSTVRGWAARRRRTVASARTVADHHHARAPRHDGTTHRSDCARCTVT